MFSPTCRLKEILQIDLLAGDGRTVDASVLLPMLSGQCEPLCLTKCLTIM